MSAIAVSEPVVEAGWATELSAGSPIEADQSLSFILTPENPSLFTASGQPRIDPISGDLSFTPAPGASGETEVSLVLQDSGSASGACPGSMNRSEPVVFTISIVAGRTDLGLTPDPDPEDPPTSVGAGVAVANNGELEAVGVMLTATADDGRLLDGFSRVSGCRVVPRDDGKSEVRCDDVAGILDWSCQTVGNTLTCTLDGLVSDAPPAVLAVRSAIAGQGSTQVQVEVFALNADRKAVVITVGN